MTIADGIDGRAPFDLAPGARSLPFTVKKRGARGWGVALLLAAALPVLAAAVALTMWAAGVPGVRRNTWVGYGALGVVPLALGLHLVQRRREWRFTADAVSYMSRGLVGNRHWTEPLDRYEGVLRWRTTAVAGIKTVPATELVLKHATDKTRCVKLYASASETAARGTQQRYASLFGVPSLAEGNVKGAAVLDPAPLMTLRERIASGHVRPTIDGEPPPAGGLTVHIAAGEVRLVARPAGIGMLRNMAAARFPIWTFVLAQGVLPLIGLFIPVWMVRVALAALAVALVAGTYFVLRLWQLELLVSQDGVRQLWHHPWGKSRGDLVPAGEVLDVCVREGKHRPYGPAVEVVGGERALVFGAGLKPAEQEWAKDLVVAVLGGASSPPAAPLP